MFKFTITEDYEIIFYDTESHLVFSLGVCLVEIQRNVNTPRYGIINPLAFLTQYFMKDEDSEEQDEQTYIALSYLIRQGIGYPQIHNNYFDEQKIFKDNSYHSINSSDMLWSQHSLMETYFSGTLQQKVNTLDKAMKMIHPSVLCYNTTAAGTAVKSLTTLYPEGYQTSSGYPFQPGTVLYVMNQYTNTAQNPMFVLYGSSVPIYNGTQQVTITNLDLAGEAGKIFMYYFYAEYNGSTWTPMLLYLGRSSLGNTTGATDTSDKIYLVGATSQTTNPQTYSDDEVYTTNGTLTAKEYALGINAIIDYNTTEDCIEFNFN